MASQGFGICAITCCLVALGLYFMRREPIAELALKTDY